MKTLLTILFAAIFLAACNNPEGTKPAPKIEDVAYFEWQGADYWVMQYDSTATNEDLKAHFKKATSTKKTSWVFFYPDSEDNSLYKTEKFNQADFLATVVKYKPGHSFYRMMPMDTTINEDGYDIIKAAATTTITKQ